MKNLATLNPPERDRRTPAVRSQRPGEIPLKQWIAEEAHRCLVTPGYIRDRLAAGFYRGKIKLRRQNERVIFVTITK